jgi:hypothetical protein
MLYPNVLPSKAFTIRPIEITSYVSPGLGIRVDVSLARCKRDVREKIPAGVFNGSWSFMAEALSAATAALIPHRSA